jgi:hypothetical protein
MKLTGQQVQQLHDAVLDVNLDAMAKLRNLGQRV